MRAEQEMYDLILRIAREDERVRAVGLNGSRANPNAPADRFQDFDVVYLVTELDSFVADKNWIDVFGERVILQTPEDMELFPATLGGWFSYLMQFEDGNRIDLMLIPLSDLERYLSNDRILKILLDKDGRIPPLPPSTDEDFHVKRPTAAFFDDCCNEFWWLASYVAKGLWRHELLYAAYHVENGMREQLLHMLSWQVGIDTAFGLSVGKCCKYLPQYLNGRESELLMRTYRLDSEETCARAMAAACELFRLSSQKVAGFFGYQYPDYDKKVSAYLNRTFAELKWKPRINA